MRPFRSLAARWQISVLCLTAFLAPIIGAAIAPVPAAAQIGIADQIAVVDFRNVSKIPNDMFGTMATDAVAVELLRSGRFSSVSADVLQNGMEKLGYKARGERTSKFALTQTMLSRVGHEVVADLVVTGEIVAIEVDQERKKADVTLAVRMLDTISSEWINGAVATGSSYPRIGYTADKDTDWIIEAVNNAARTAVSTMVQYIIPEATVIGTFGTDQVLLDKGTRDGLMAGMEMVAFRRGEGGEDEVVGRLRVTRVTNTDARAAVTQSLRGAQPEDRVRAVYTPPSDPLDARTPVSKAQRQERLSAGNKLLWTVLAAAGLYYLLRPGGSRESVPNAVARSFASPANFGSMFHDGGIVIAWNTPGHLAHNDIIEYHVWRDSRGSYFPIGGGSNYSGPVLTPDFTTAMPIDAGFGRYRHSTIDDATGRSPMTYRYPSNDNSSLETGSVELVHGITAGRQHNYYVSCVYRRLPAKSGDEGGSISYHTTTPVHAGQATYFYSRPVTSHPGSLNGQHYVDLRDVYFEWQGCRGADEYVIEVSASPDFPRAETWVGKHFQPTQQDGQTISKTFRDVLSRSSELSSIQPDQMLYWRVGAKNRLDKPGPVPAGPSPQLDGDKHTCYIYSDPNELFMFMKLGGVPEPPSGGDPGGGGDMPPPPPQY